MNDRICGTDIDQVGSLVERIMLFYMRLIRNKRNKFGNNFELIILYFNFYNKLPLTENYAGDHTFKILNLSILQDFSKLDASFVEHVSTMKAAIPVLPVRLAWICLILNVFLPGFGE